MKRSRLSKKGSNFNKSRMTKLISLNMIDERIKESEDILKANGTTFDRILTNKDGGEENNFEAGVISGLKEVKRMS